MKALLTICALLLVCAVQTSRLASAAEGDSVPEASEVPAYDPDQLSDEGFSAAAEGETDEDTIPGGPLMRAAYLALLGLLGGYGVRLAHRHRDVQAELAELRKMLEDIDDKLDESSDAA